MKTSWRLGLAATVALSSCSNGAGTTSTGTGSGGTAASTTANTSANGTTASNGSTVGSTTSNSATSSAATTTGSTSATGSTTSASASSSTGGMCPGNVCNATVIDPGFHFVRAIDVDATDVVWVDNNGMYRAPKDGSGSETLITTQTDATYSIHIVGANVYFGSSGSGLNVVPKAGGTKMQVTGGANYANFATDGVHAFTVELGTLGGPFSLPLVGGTQTQLPTAGNDPIHAAQCFSYAFDGTNIYDGCIVNMTQNRMFVVPTTGAPSTSWATTLYPMAVNSTYVFAEVAAAGGAYSIQGIDKATMGAPTTFIQSASVVDLHVDDANLYYLAGSVANTQLYRAPIVANATPTSLAGPMLYSEEFAMDASYLYFADASGRIVRIAK